MYNVHYLNKISPKGTALWTDSYTIAEHLEGADAALVRSASMHEMELPESLLAVARAGAGVNNIPLTSCADQGIVVFNTPGANANGVMEMALCGMLLACRDVVGGINWVQSIKGSPDVAKLVEKGFDIIEGTHPCVPVMLYDEHLAVEYAKKMMEKGVYVVAFSYPVVPKGRARIRTQVCASHTKEDIDFVIRCFEETRAELQK